MKTSIEVLASDPRVKAMLGSVHTDTVRVSAAETVLRDQSWSEGSQDDYYPIDLQGRERLPGEEIERVQINAFGTMAPKYRLARGEAWIRRSVFRGKRMRDEILMHPEDFANWIGVCTIHEDCRACPELARECAANGGGVVSMSKRTKAILDTFGFKSAYRKQEWERMGVQSSELDELVQRGLVSKNKAGAMALTPAGRVARSQ